MKTVQGPKKETLKHIEAFNLYYEMGDQRSYDKVANALGVNRGTITKWAVAFDWQRRVVERDHEIGERLARETDKKIYRNRLRFLDIIEKSVNLYEEALDKKTASTPSHKEFRSLVDAYEQIAMQVDHGTADVFNQKSTVSSTTSKTISDLERDLMNIEEPEDDDRFIGEEEDDATQ